MKQFLLFILLFGSGFSQAKELEIAVLEPDSVIAVPDLGSTCIVTFRFPNANDLSSPSISYSLDDQTGNHQLVTNDGDGTLKIITTAGWHNLQFYYSSYFYEEYTNIEIEAGNHYYYSVYFTPSEVIEMTEKPVIYLYPEKELNVQVKVHPTGDFTFTYPEYKNGWDVLAAPNGNLVVDGESYNYLFWEASEKVTNENVNFNTGFTVSGANVTDFLEEKLREVGLNGIERADFITFWAPRMAQNSDVFVQFYFNEECNQFSELVIEPKPDNIYRIYMVWQPVDQLRVAPTPQKLSKMNREGFTVLEWGGQELPATKLVRAL